jgi:hypothetical protein
MTPEQIIGEAALKRLVVAGFDVTRRPPPPATVSRYTCACGYSARGGEGVDAHAEWGRWWHRACYPRAPRAYDTTAHAMVETREAR